MPERAATIALAPLSVRTDAASVRAYAEAIAPDGPPRNSIPFWFPLCWLPDLAFREAIAMADDAVLLHKSQSIAYARSLSLECEYRLEATLHVGPRKPATARFPIRLEAIVRDAEAVVMEMVSELIVVEGARF